MASPRAGVLGWGTGAGLQDPRIPGLIDLTPGEPSGDNHGAGRGYPRPPRLGWRPSVSWAVYPVPGRLRAVWPGAAGSQCLWFYCSGQPRQVPGQLGVQAAVGTPTCPDGQQRLLTGTGSRTGSAGSPAGPC